MIAAIEGRRWKGIGRWEFKGRSRREGLKEREGKRRKGRGICPPPPMFQTDRRHYMLYDYIQIFSSPGWAHELSIEAAGFNRQQLKKI
jgi:hypothetical protein